MARRATADRILSSVGDVLRRRGRRWEVVHRPLEHFLQDHGDHEQLVDCGGAVTSSAGNACSWRSVGHGTVHVFDAIGRRPHLIARIKAAALLEVVELLARARKVRERAARARRGWDRHHEEWEARWAEEARRQARLRRARSAEAKREAELRRLRAWTERADSP